VARARFGVIDTICPVRYLRAFIWFVLHSARIARRLTGVRTPPTSLSVRFCATAAVR
jgi:hypothetical protein